MSVAAWGAYVGLLPPGGDANAAGGTPASEPGPGGPKECTDKEATQCAGRLCCVSVGLQAPATNFLPLPVNTTPCCAFWGRGQRTGFYSRSHPWWECTSPRGAISVVGCTIFDPWGCCSTTPPVLKVPGGPNKKMKNGRWVRAWTKIQTLPGYYACFGHTFIAQGTLTPGLC